MKTLNEVGIGLSCGLWEGFFSVSPQKTLGFDDGAWWFSANHFLVCLGVNIFVYLLVFIYWTYILC